MFKKACGFDDSVVFYFDRYDNKHVARGGSLAWRLNNPGLISSHSSFAKKFGLIGGHKQYAIFPSKAKGVEALRAWLSAKFGKCTLKEIAQHYQPEDPGVYLKKLLDFVPLSIEKKIGQLGKEEFELLLRAIQVANGYSQEKRGQFDLLPKITSKFASRDQRVIYYLIGYDALLTQAEAIEWIGSHRLDAVIVHKLNGTVYLRSRPGHHPNVICFTENEYGEDKGIDDAIREVGKEEPGQTIWGYINGIFTNRERALDCASMISNYAGGQQVWSLVNDRTVLSAGRLGDAIFQRFGAETDSVKTAVYFLKFLLSLADRIGYKKPVIIIAHSQGALIIDLALDSLSIEERQRLRVFTFGGLVLISHDKVVSHNYFSIRDPIPGLGSKSTYLSSIKLHEKRKKGLTTQQIIDAYIEEDLISYFQNESPFEPIESIDDFKKKRLQYYENELRNMKNVTVLDDAQSTSLEHSFDLPCYQEKLKEIILQNK